MVRVTNVTIGLPVTDLSRARRWYEAVLDVAGPDLEPVEDMVEYRVGEAWLQLGESRGRPGGSVVRLATLTSKGQITIPAEVRGALGLHPGSRVAFVRTRDGAFELVPATTSVTALKGMVPARARPVTLEEMDEAVAQGAAGSGQR